MKLFLFVEEEFLSTLSNFELVIFFITEGCLILNIATTNPNQGSLNPLIRCILKG